LGGNVNDGNELVPAKLIPAATIPDCFIKFLRSIIVYCSLKIETLKVTKQKKMPSNTMTFF
jgi:hypothetical protein